MRRLRIGKMQNEINDISRTAAIPTPEVFIDEAECLRRVPVSRRTWFSWRTAGKIPTVKLGRRCLYHWPSVEAALLGQQRGGGM
jgi:hypothetical protein